MAKKARIVWDVNPDDLEKSLKLLKQIRKEAGLTDDQVEEIGESFEENEKSIKKNVAGLEDLKGTVAKLGIAAAITGAVIAFGKLAIEIQKSRKEVALLTDLTGRELDKVTAKIKALSNVWDKDFNEVLRAANTLSQEFDISMSDAIENINEGFSRGIDINGEYLDSIREYSLFAKEAGLTAKQFNIVLQDQLKKGIFSDKGIDAIKEAVLSLREMTPVAREALQAIGMNAEEVISDLNSGARTYFDVIQEVSKRTRETTDQVAKGMVFADIFKGAGEDAGDFVLQLDKLNIEYDTLNKEQQQYYDLQQKLIDNQEDFNDALIASTKSMGEAWNQIKANILPALTKMIELLAGHDYQIQKLVEGYKDDLAETAAPLLKKRLDEVNASLEEQKTKMDAVKEQMRLNPKFAELNAQKYTELSQATRELSAEQKALTELIGESEDRFNAYVDSIGETVDEIDDIDEVTKDALRSINDLNNAIDSLLKNAPSIEHGSFFENLIFGGGEGSEEKLLERADQLSEQLAEKTLAANQEQTRIQDEEALKREQIQQGSFMLAAELSNTFTGLKLSNLQREFDAAAGNDKKQRAIMQKMAEVEKRQAAFRTIINTAQGIISALALFPPNPVLAAFIGATVRLIRVQILAQPLPKFKKGGMVKGKSHAQGGVVIEAEGGEYIARKEAVKQYPELLKRVNSLQLDKSVVDRIMSGKSDGVTVVNSNKELIDALKDKPDWQVMVDEDGFTTRMRSKFGSYTQQRNRFRQ